MKNTPETNTYDGWRSVGYHVIKGRKSCGRNANMEAIFSENDVEVTLDNVGDMDYEHPMESVLQEQYCGD